MRRHAAAVVLIVGCVAAGCGGSDDAATSGALRAEVKAGVTESAGNIRVPPRTPYVYLTDALCVTSGSARVTAVRPVDPTGGMRLVDWTLTSMSGGVDGTDVAHAVLVAPSRRAITNTCATRNSYGIDPPRGVVVTLEYTGRSPAIAHGFEVTSTNGTAFIPFLIQLCSDDCGAPPLLGDSSH